MTNPIGLTRSEEASEQGQTEVRVVVVAPPGVDRCRASVPPNGDDCKAEAKFLVIWSDEDRTPMCRECAMHAQQMAQSHRTNVKVEPIRLVSSRA
jgi:hypothetical protein